MPDYTRLAGSLDVSVVVFIFDPATGVPDTGVLFNTAGLDLRYRREGAAATALTEVTLAALTTAHTDGGFLHIGNGYYRLDLPDAAVAAGAPGVLVYGGLTSRSIVGCYIHLVAYNPQDAVRLGLTALPNVASGSAGAIPTTGAGANQISVTSGHVTLLDGSLTAGKIATDAITAAKVAADVGVEIGGAVWDIDIDSAHQTANTAGKRLDDASTTVATNLNATVSSRSTFNPAADTVNLSTTTETQIDNITSDTAEIHDTVLANLNATVSSRSTFNPASQTVNLSTTSESQIDAIEARTLAALPNAAPGATGGLLLYDDFFSVVAEGNIVTVTNAGDLRLDTGFNASDGFYAGMFLVPQSGNAAKQPRAITIYTGSTRRCQFIGTGSQISRPFSVTPTPGDPVKILGLSGTI